MALPKQVEQDLADIAEYEKSLAEPAVAAQTAPEPITAEPVAPVVDVAPVEPEVPSSPAVDVRPHDPEETWEQRYRTLKGMFESQVPTLHAKNKELENSMRVMTAEFEKLKTAPVPAVGEKFVTDQDEESFGKDLIDLQRRVAKESLTPLQAKLDHLERENVALRDMAGKTGSQVATFSFENQLQASIPDFTQTNTDPRWFAWLDTVDPILRAPRRSAAQAAYANGDVEGVAHYMALFRQEAGAARKPDTRQAELQSQVAPSRSAASAAPAQATERTYTSKEWDTLFDKVAALNRQGKTDEASKLETELSNAYTAGRVGR